MTKRFHILITRPEQQGRVLAEQLEQLGMRTSCQPFFDISPVASNCSNISTLNEHSFHAIVFISVAAVEHANRLMPLAQWPTKHVIAVGQSSAKALAKHGISPICPDIQTSEGMLALPELAEVAQQHIAIVRGNGGRELLAQQLGQAGAIVHYIESYQRVWRTLASELPTQWQLQQVNCVVITSNALLESIVHLLKLPNNYWQNTCLWVVASERIAKNARNLGFKNVINAHGANDQVIINAITSYGKNHDR